MRPDKSSPLSPDDEDAARRRDGRRVALAFVGAVLLHASTALAFISWTPEPVAPPGEMVITIDLAPAMASAEAQPIAGETAPSAPQTPSPPEPEPQPEEIVEEVKPEPLPPEELVEEEVKPEEIPEPVEPVEPPPETAEQQEEIEPPPPAEKADVVVATKPVPMPKPKPKIKPKPKPAPPAPAQTARSARKQRADVAGTGASASPSEINKYVGRVRSAIERNKRYPSAAGGASGRVHVTFTITRSGSVTGLKLTRSSGHPALDAAARNAIASANIPPIPKGLPETLSLGQPINFHSR